VSAPGVRLPKFYAIIDAACFDGQRSLLKFAQDLVEGGATLLQYRNKTGCTREVLSDTRALKRMLGAPVRLIMNDRPDLCLAADLDGVHVGQDDLSVEAARRVLGGTKWIGFSTHNVEQAIAAEGNGADYVAVGPIFKTSSKAKPDPVVGIGGLKEIRRQVKKPLVAIGGITRENCAEAIAAGADSVAVIADLIANSGEDSAGKRVEDFFRRLE